MGDSAKGVVVNGMRAVRYPQNSSSKGSVHLVVGNCLLNVGPIVLLRVYG